MQLDHAIVVGVRNAVQLSADRCRGAELFLDLPPQAGVERFVGEALAAGKLPIAFEMRAVGTPRHEEAFLPFDHRGGDHEQRASHASISLARVRD
jgi:hypothetical protein